MSKTNGMAANLTAALKNKRFAAVQPTDRKQDP